MWVSLSEAAGIVTSGGVIAYPTEAVYGLGCDPLNQQAVMRLLAIKQRPVHKGLILLASHTDQLKTWVDATPEQWQQMDAKWPAAVTFLVTPTAKVPAWITGEHPKVAVRVSGHAGARAIAQQANTPIVSTSANLAGEDAYRLAGDVAKALGSLLDGVVQGDCNISDRPSTIIDLETQQIIRQ